MTDKIVHGYKLLTLRRDGTLGSLFVNRAQRLALHEWYHAEDHAPLRLKHRPGWHAVADWRKVEHLSEHGRVWCHVSLRGVKFIPRPRHQGEIWMIARHLRIDAIFAGIL